MPDLAAQILASRMPDIGAYFAAATAAGGSIGGRR
jgi:hypothetical protein